jgi:hypothetical protein
MKQQNNSQWLGIHVLVGNNAEIDALGQETPKLASMGINTLIIEVNYNFAYTSHPELRAENPITQDHAHSLASICQENGVRLIPQFQCLGHQSWSKTTYPLLTQYPQFDETPGQFPDNDGIYCRSWCPQHPDINPIIFALFDELLDAFEANALNVGMDEVFLIASEHCPRCKGHNPAKLFAKAVNDYYAYLVGQRGVEMLMWGDRLLDDATTGYGEWESATNGTAPAIDLVPTDIIICDWHYELRKTYPSIPLFLEKGFRVWPSGWKNVEATQALLAAGQQHKSAHMLGHLCTTWGAVKLGGLAEFPAIHAATEY